MKLIECSDCDGMGAFTQDGSRSVFASDPGSRACSRCHGTGKVESHQTNQERVDEYMTLGSPMNQLFLIEAVTRYAKQVVESKDKVRKQMKNSFIHPEAWIGSAEAWLKTEVK